MRENMGYFANGKGFLHRQIAEKALGRPLPKHAEVHHVDGDKKNNRNENLVICQDSEYHMLLHRRSAAMNAGYPANYRKCQTCKQFDSPENLYIQNRGTKGWRVRHKKCHAQSEYFRKQERT